MAQQQQPKQKSISFEAPLYRQPSDHLRNFMEKLMRKPAPCHAIWREDQKLTFYVSKSEKATVAPFFRKTEKPKNVVNKMKAFASKFNVTNIAVVKDEADMYFELLSPADLAEKDEKMDPSYGDGVLYVMRVRVTCKSNEATRVLLKFYGTLDMSIEPLHFNLQLQDWPSRDLSEFAKQMNQANYPCYAVAHGHEKLLITAKNLSENQIIIPSNVKKEDEKTIAKSLSIFASKLNATSTFIDKKQVSIRIDFLHVHEFKAKYGETACNQCDENTVCVMQVNVTCTEAEARNVLGDFFKMLDKYGN